MIFEQFVRTLDEAGESLGHIPLREIVADAPAAYVVRGSELHGGAAAGDDETVAIADSGVEREDIVAELFLEIFHELAAFLGGDLARRVVLHGLVLEGVLVAESDEVGAKGDIVALHLYADGQRLEGGSAGVAVLGVVAERAEIGDIAARLEAVGHRLDQTYPARLREHVDHGFICRFERRFAAEGGHGVVRHAVAEYESVFHKRLLRKNLNSSAPLCQMVQRLAKSGFLC